MNVHGCSKVVGFLVFGLFAWPVSAQVEEMSEPASEAEAVVEAEAAAEVEAEVEAAEETEEWATPKKNQVFFRGA